MTQTARAHASWSSIGTVASLLNAITRHGTANSDTIRDIKALLIDSAELGYDRNRFSNAYRVALESIATALPGSSE